MEARLESADPWRPRHAGQAAAAGILPAQARYAATVRPCRGGDRQGHLFALARRRDGRAGRHGARLDRCPAPHRAARPPGPDRTAGAGEQQLHRQRRARWLAGRADLFRDRRRTYCRRVRSPAIRDRSRLAAPARLGRGEGCDRLYPGPLDHTRRDHAGPVRPAASPGRGDDRALDRVPGGRDREGQPRRATLVRTAALGRRLPVRPAPRVRLCRRAARNRLAGRGRTDGPTDL